MSATLQLAQLPPFRADRLQPAHLLFLAAALVLHSLLLILPLDTGPRYVRATEPLAITLSELTRATPATQAEKPVETLPAAKEMVPPVEAEPVQVKPVEQKPEPVITETIAPVPRKTTSTINHLSAALLLNSARQRQWRLPVFPGSTASAERASSALPPNWTVPLMPMTPNHFDDAVLPRTVEVIDRWRDPDGTHQVVINTPTGHTLCGRAAPWDPMEPLVEHVMVMRPCAGGGKRRMPITIPETLRFE
jgi:hypothetical protein